MAKKKRSATVKGTSTKKNKLGVKDSLVNNITARKRTGRSRSKKRSTISKEAYHEMQNNWGKKK